MRLPCMFVAIAIAVLILLICQLLLEGFLQDDSWQIHHFQIPKSNSYSFKEVTWPVVLWWEPLSGPTNPGTLRQCGQLSCYFTDDRHFHHHSQLKAIMFYGTTMALTDLPLPRNGASVLWALLHEESPRNNAPLSHSAAISLFNYTATFSRFSSYPLTTQYLKSVQALTDLKFFVSTEEKRRLQRDEGLAPIIYIQSDCSTTNNRDSYVVELAKYISVDSYGECLNNKDLPLHLRFPHHLDTMMSDDLMRIIAKYKFVLAIENGVCYDYITEKLWRPLITGSVPVYIGSPTVSDWLPNNKSALLGLDFESPKALAEYLHTLNNNDDNYNSYLSHKLRSEVKNSRLVKTVEEREWDTEWSERGSYVENFACFVCKAAHNLQTVSVATTEHYLCPMPESILSHSPNRSNYWLNSWFYGACEANVARKFIDSGLANFTHQEYKDALHQLMIQNKCVYSVGNAGL